MVKIKMDLVGKTKREQLVERLNKHLRERYLIMDTASEAYQHDEISITDLNSLNEILSGEQFATGVKDGMYPIQEIE